MERRSSFVLPDGASGVVLKGKQVGTERVKNTQKEGREPVARYHDDDGGHLPSSRQNINVSLTVEECL